MDDRVEYAMSWHPAHRMGAGWVSTEHPHPVIEVGIGPVVYFIQAGENGPIKIGFTSNLPQRLLELQIGNWQKLRILAAFPGDASKERAIHKGLARYRIRGEWFQPAKPVFKAMSLRC